MTLEKSSPSFKSHRSNTLLENVHTYGRLNNVQRAMDTKHHLIVSHEVTNIGDDRSQRTPSKRGAHSMPRPSRLFRIAGITLAKRSLAGEEAVIIVSLPKPM